MPVAADKLQTATEFHRGLSLSKTEVKIMTKQFKPLTRSILIALIGLLVQSPIFLFVMIALTIANNGKPFFFQKRPGKNEKIFSIIKFKTMNDKRDAQGKLVYDVENLTYQSLIYS